MLLYVTGMSQSDVSITARFHVAGPHLALRFSTLHGADHRYPQWWCVLFSLQISNWLHEAKRSLWFSWVLMSQMEENICITELDCVTELKHQNSNFKFLNAMRYRHREYCSRSLFLISMLYVLTGTIMTISKDRVKPSPQPDSWKLAEIFTTGIILGGYLAMMTVIFFWAAYKTDFFPVNFVFLWWTISYNMIATNNCSDVYLVLDLIKKEKGWVISLFWPPCFFDDGYITPSQI